MSMSINHPKQTPFFTKISKCMIVCMCKYISMNFRGWFCDGGNGGQWLLST